MSRFFSSKYDELVPYVPGEQPRFREYVKLNTNESPFPPSEKALKAAQEEASEPKKGKNAGTKQPETVEKEPENGTDEPESGTEAEETGTAPEVDTEKLKVEVRKLLTKVNKQTGKNQAKEWITNLGHDSLTDVEDADDLLALKGLAEEVLNA